MLDTTLRAELQKPFGDLCSKERCKEKLAAFDIIITVGDITTCHLIRWGIIPDICIVDDIAMREPVPDAVRNTIHADSRTTYTADNPAGTISLQLIDSVHRAVMGVARHERARIVVRGEEDLAVIPAVIEAPKGAAVVYGQPNEGMVITAVTAEKQRNAEYLLRKVQEAVST